jgi:hypothetical protein
MKAFSDAHAAYNRKELEEAATRAEMFECVELVATHYRSIDADVCACQYRQLRFKILWLGVYCGWLLHLFRC